MSRTCENQDHELPLFPAQKYVTKKATRNPHRCRFPPKPPFKTSFRSAYSSDRAQAVSFHRIGLPCAALSKCYDPKCEQSYFEQCFDDANLIGQGSFGNVYEARSRDDGLMYAVKISKLVHRSETERRRRLLEVKKHEMVPENENCVRLIRAWEDQERLHMQLELCSTSLDHYADKHSPFSPDEVWEIFLDMLVALKHLHDENLVHLDIKLENILMATSGHCKLADFGLLIDVTTKVSDAVEGDPKYLAVEIMSGYFTKAADIFSLGICLLELLTDLELPSGGVLWHELRNNRLPAEYVDNIPDDLLGLIKKMMAHEFEERPDVDALLAHPHIRFLIDKRGGISFCSSQSSGLRWVYRTGKKVLKSVASLVPNSIGFLHSGKRKRGDDWVDTSFSEVDVNLSPSPYLLLSHCHLHRSSHSAAKLGISPLDFAGASHSTPDPGSPLGICRLPATKRFAGAKNLLQSFDSETDEDRGHGSATFSISEVTADDTPSDDTRFSGFSEVTSNNSCTSEEVTASDDGIADSGTVDNEGLTESADENHSVGDIFSTDAVNTDINKCSRVMNNNDKSVYGYKAADACLNVECNSNACLTNLDDVYGNERADEFADNNIVFYEESSVLEKQVLNLPCISEDTGIGGCSDILDDEMASCEEECLQKRNRNGVHKLNVDRESDPIANGKVIPVGDIDTNHSIY